MVDSGPGPAAMRLRSSKIEEDDQSHFIGSGVARAQAGWLSRLTFSYLDGLIQQGYKRPLRQQDLGIPDELCEARGLNDRFQREWELEVERVGRLPVDARTGRISQPMLHEVLRALFERKLVYAAFIKLLNDGTQLSVPMVFNGLITHLQRSDEWEDDEVYHGYYFAMALFALSLSKAILESQYLFRVQTLGVCVRNLIISRVYAKSLLLSQASRQRRSTGETVNIMQVDSLSLEMMCMQINYLWSGMLMILGLSAQLLYFVGPSGLAGIVVMVVLVPVQKKIMIRTMMLRKQSQASADSRVKQVGEVLNGIRAVKLNAWEGAFQASVAAMRAAELSDLKVIRLLRAASVVLFSCTPVLVAVVTIVFYTAVAGNELDPATVFTALVLVSALRMPLAFYPSVLNSASMAMIALRRVNVFLNEEEVGTTRVLLKSELARQEAEARAAKERDASQRSVVTHPGPGTFAYPQLPHHLAPALGTPALVAPAGGEEADVALAKAVVVRQAQFSWEGDVQRQVQYEMEKKASEARLAKIRASSALGRNRKPPTAAPAEASAGLKRETFVLGRDARLDLQVSQGSLFAVVGPVGSGKSSFCSALLGEMNALQGTVKLSGSVAYVPQQAWILNQSLRSNIVFGRPYDEAKFQEAIRVCELQRDVDTLPRGVDTEIGEKGVNISGGQKQRVSLARAVYSEADIYIMDDPLSALDAHVGKRVFNQCICAKLGGRTRILVTNQLQYLHKVDHIVTVKDGELVEAGAFDDLMGRQGEFANLMAEHGTAEDPASASDEEDETASSMLSASAQVLVGGGQEAPATAASRGATAGPGGGLTQAEHVHQGGVRRAVLWKYLHSTGSGFLGAAVVVFFVLTMAVLAVSDWWLAYWMDETKGGRDGRGLGFYLGMYVAISLSAALTTYLRQMGILQMSVRASKSLHDEMFVSVLKCPIAFFDTTPVGRVIARFSRDIDTIDQTLADSLSQFMQCAFTVATSIIMIVVFLNLVAAFIFPLMLVYYYIMLYYRASSRQLKRMDAISRSPIFSTFSETLMGLDSIRAYDQKQRFMDILLDLVNLNVAAYYPLKTLERWIALRLETIGALVVLCTACMAVWQHSQLYVGVAALVLYRASSLTGVLNFTVRSAVECENQLTAVERLLEYVATLPSEAEFTKEADEAVATTWPERGDVRFQDVHMRYREGLEPALRGVTAFISGREKVGVVGRTGAGKSSLMVALFRLVETSHGTITIDDVDISTLGLSTLRGAMGVVPQDPVLFSGLVRFNLDPFSQHDDGALINALDQCNLSNVFDLAEQVTEYGHNFSAGQRQLLCMARCLVNKPKIILLDEATSAVDYTTDQMIQTTIRTGFANCTVITIAHRLQTIADSDRVMCIAGGRVVDFDSPKVLLENDQSIYASLVREAGNQETLNVDI